MAASADDVARLRRLTAEPTEDTYTDEAFESAIERYPINDSDGNEPDDSDWTATYNVYLAASEIWTEKAAAIAGSYDFTADGSSFQRSQLYEQYTQQARVMQQQARRVGNNGGIRSVTQQAAGPFRGTLGEPWIGNQPEEEIT